MFGIENVGMPTPMTPDGSRQRPLKAVRRAVMNSKGAHTLIEALIQLKQRGLNVQASLAGDSFQRGYREQLEKLLKQNNLDGVVQFVFIQNGRLSKVLCPASRRSVPVYSSRSLRNCGRRNDGLRLVVVSSGVGGAGELIDDGRTGLLFQPGDTQGLARCLL